MCEYGRVLDLVDSDTSSSDEVHRIVGGAPAPVFQAAPPSESESADQTVRVASLTLAPYCHTRPAGCPRGGTRQGR